MESENQEVTNEVSEPAIHLESEPRNSNYIDESRATENPTILRLKHQLINQLNRPKSKV